MKEKFLRSKNKYQLKFICEGIGIDQAKINIAKTAEDFRALLRTRSYREIIKAWSQVK